jgi:hypothetical protein
MLSYAISHPISVILVFLCFCSLTCLTDGLTHLLQAGGRWFVYPSVLFSVRPSRLSVCLFVCPHTVSQSQPVTHTVISASRSALPCLLSVCPSVCPSVCLSVRLSVCLSVCLSLSVCLFTIYLSVCCP